MVGTIELDQDGQNRLIRFPYRPDLVEQVRTLPGRRWDKGHKVWRVPATEVDAVYLMFSAHRFEFSSEVSGLLAGTVRVQAPAKEKTKTKAKVCASQVQGFKRIYLSSIQALNSRIQRKLL